MKRKCAQNVSKAQIAHISHHIACPPPCTERDLWRNVFTQSPQLNTWNITTLKGTKKQNKKQTQFLISTALSLHTATLIGLYEQHWLSCEEFKLIFYSCDSRLGKKKKDLYNFTIKGIFLHKASYTVYTFKNGLTTSPAVVVTYFPLMTRELRN